LIATISQKPVHCFSLGVAEALRDAANMTDDMLRAGRKNGKWWNNLNSGFMKRIFNRSPVKEYDKPHPKHDRQTRGFNQ